MNARALRLVLLIPLVLFAVSLLNAPWQVPSAAGQTAPTSVTIWIPFLGNLPLGVWTRTLDTSGLQVRDIAIDPSNPSIVYAATGDGLYKSLNGGLTWNRVEGNLLPQTAIISVAVDPVTPATIYVSTYFAMYKSGDSGANWTILFVPHLYAAVNAFAFDPQNPSTVYAATDNGLDKSVDGGRTWSTLGTGTVAIQFMGLAVDPQAPATVYAGAQAYYVGTFIRFGAVLKSTDAGANWSMVFDGLTSVYVFALAIDPKTPTTVYAGTDSGVYKSMDAGATWSHLSGGIPTSGVSVRRIVIDPQMPSTLYAATLSAGVYKSTDGGATWSALNTGLTDNVVYALALDPWTGRTLYAGTYANGVFVNQQ